MLINSLSPQCILGLPTCNPFLKCIQKEGSWRQPSHWESTFGVLKCRLRRQLSMSCNSRFQCGLTTPVANIYSSGAKHSLFRDWLFITKRISQAWLCVCKHCDYSLSRKKTKSERGESIVNGIWVFQWCVTVTRNTLNTTRLSSALSLSCYHPSVYINLYCPSSLAFLEVRHYIYCAGGTMTVFLLYRTVTVNKSIKCNDLDICGSHKKLGVISQFTPKQCSSLIFKWRIFVTLYMDHSMNLNKHFYKHFKVCF